MVSSPYSGVFMLHHYSINVSFGRPVTVFRTKVPVTAAEMPKLLQLRPFDERDWHRLMGLPEGSLVMAMLDLEFSANQEFGVASEESEVMARALQLADRLYEFTLENYDEVAEKVLRA